MKNLIICLFSFLTITSYGQDAKYIQAMEKNIAILDSTIDPSQLQNANNVFQRIGNLNPKEWLPLYYQGYCNLMIGIGQEENNKKDEYYDNAQQLVDKAAAISPDNSEILVMQSFITSMKISVDPMSRGQKLSMQSSMLIENAIKLDKDNPRAYLLKGSGLMYRPVQYGGGKEKAIPVLEEAVAKFKSFKPSSSIMPHWGERRAVEVLEQCKK